MLKLQKVCGQKEGKQIKLERKCEMCENVFKEQNALF